MDHQKTYDAQEQPLNSLGPAFDIVALAASAGGLNALSQVLSQLPANFPVPLLIQTGPCRSVNPSWCIFCGPLQT